MSPPPDGANVDFDGIKVLKMPPQNQEFFCQGGIPFMLQQNLFPQLPPAAANPCRSQPVQYPNFIRNSVLQYFQLLWCRVAGLLSQRSGSDCLRGDTRSSDKP